jgi:DNA-binding NarL/FixJ family response regulator
VLIIDACDASRSEAAAVLTRAGHEVFEADGEDVGFVLLVCDEPDVVLINPEGAGPEDSALVRQLRAGVVEGGVGVLAWTDTAEGAAPLGRARSCGVVSRRAAPATLAAAVETAIRAQERPAARRSGAGAGPCRDGVYSSST